MPQRPEVGGVGSSLSLRARSERCWQRRTPRSDREPRAALRPARAQNLAPANTLHAGTETVRSLAANDGGLVGTFHGAAFDGKSLTLERFAYHSVKDHQAFELLCITRVRAEYNGADGPRTVPALFSSLAPEQLIHVDPRILAELPRVVSA